MAAATPLEDLLALLPDNDTGAIDAADLRVIVTALYEAFQGEPAGPPVTIEGGNAFVQSASFRVGPNGGAGMSQLIMVNQDGDARMVFVDSNDELQVTYPI